MWIHVPSRFCPSAPAEGDSTSDSGWRSQMLASSATLRTKRSHARYWLRAWETEPWMTRLFGRIYEPSTAARGVESWIASLAGTLANRSVVPEGKGGRMILDTCGHTSPRSSGSAGRASSSSRTSRTTSGSASSPSGMNYARWVTLLKRESLARRKWALHTFASGSSSSAGWSTPLANDAEKRGRVRVGAGLAGQCQSWPTPRAEDGESCGNHPGATDSLTGATRNWELCPYGPQGRGTSGGGKKSSAGPGEDRRLNPRFASWLMGWPMGWSSPLSMQEPTSFASWGTAWSRHVRRWLTEYFSRGCSDAGDDPPCVFVPD